MADNKRFEIREGRVKHIIEHNHPRIPMMFSNMDEICDRLNELYAENEVLKRDNDNFIATLASIKGLFLDKGGIVRLSELEEVLSTLWSN